MKKTLNVNLNGRVFTIDEDAYRLLDNYLTNLRLYFKKEEGSAEIINDFEARIEELFNEKTRLGHQVITLEHVEEVIARVGKPADFEGNDEKEEARQTTYAEPSKGKKRFYRNMDDKMLGGVCSGIAAYFGWSVVAIRFILIVSPFVLSSLNFLTHHFPWYSPFFVFNNLGLWVIVGYLIAWLIVPAATTAEQKLQMQGKPITVENIGKTVSAQSAPVASNEPKGCLAGVVDVFAAFLKVCLAGLGCLVGLPLLFALFIVIIVLIAVFLGVGGGLLGAGGSFFSFMPSFMVAKNPVIMMIAGILLFAIPVIAIMYSIVAYFSKSKPMNQTVKWAFLFIWIIALIVFFSSGFRSGRKNWFNNNWKWSIYSENYEIRGNGIPSQKIIDFDEAVSHLELGRYLYAELEIEQTQDIAPSIEINGDENLVDQVRYDLNGGQLVLSSFNRMRSNNNLKIKLRTNELKGIQVSYVGNIRMNRAFAGDELDIRMKGVGNFRADSLYVRALTAGSEGVGSIHISGKAEKVNLETAGTGKVDAINLLSDTVYARVGGIGAIQCNPVEYLNANVWGIGSITYKNEPKHKVAIQAGIGRIKRK